MNIREWTPTTGKPAWRHEGIKRLAAKFSLQLCERAILDHLRDKRDHLKREKVADLYDIAASRCELSTFEAGWRLAEKWMEGKIICGECNGEGNCRRCGQDCDECGGDGWVKKPAPIHTN